MGTMGQAGRMQGYHAGMNIVPREKITRMVKKDLIIIIVIMIKKALSVLSGPSQINVAQRYTPQSVHRQRWYAPKAVHDSDDSLTGKYHASSEQWASNHPANQWHPED
jgi:hypothetical protein